MNYFDDDFEATHVDGPGFTAWVLSRRPDLDGNKEVFMGKAMIRRFHEAEGEGRPMTVDMADRVCCRLDLHLGEVPDHLWRVIDYSTKKTEPTGEKVRELLDAGESIRQIAKRYGVHTGTVRRRLAFIGLRWEGTAWVRRA